MCGIAGVFGRTDQAAVAAMLDTLRPRGPDDCQLVAGDHFTLGACRLSIVDPRDGQQPLANEDGSVWAAQNGELYNFPDQRPRLEARGHQFRTRCDTELLPHLYEEVGVELPQHLDGMFAVSLWDDRCQRGLLARDRAGKKPLYYCHSADALYFASEIKALLTVPGFERRLNLEALHHYIALKHVPHPLSMFAGIHALPPAHCLVWQAGRTSSRRYWRADFSAGDRPAGPPTDDDVDELLDALRQAIRRRRMGDAPIGYFLSGGLDSSLIAALAAEEASAPIRTFTLTYADAAATPGKEQDRHWARWFAQRYQTDHSEEMIDGAQLPDLLRTAVRCFDEPFAGVISTWLLAAQMSRHVKVAISGDGADELYGSYLTHRLAGPIANYAAYCQSRDPALIRPFENEPDRLAGLAAATDWAWRAKLGVFSEAERAALYAPTLAESMRRFSTADYWQQAFSPITASDPLNRVLEAEFNTVLPDQVLTFVDRLSMAHGLEIRSPFLDSAVVALAARTPGSWKMRAGVTKHIVKRAAARLFPAEMVHRPKEGFLLPITQWLQNDHEDYVRATLDRARLARHGLFDPAVVSALVDRLYLQPCDHTHVNKVYALLAFQEWHQQYLEGTTPTRQFSEPRVLTAQNKEVHAWQAPRS